jgi:alkanesulfonate monooxygenase SsuD/methylene tetrahydromethanopterin reductase-like flavin-dependent oxidoreductase (luciferase family)
VRFGWLTLAHSPSPEDDTAAVHEQVSQACFAETAGFDGVWLTEHNFTGESVYCDPIPLASAVAARTSRVRIGFAVIQLALRHPIRLAVQLALLDNLSDGRLDVGVGRGSIYNEYEYIGYGLRSHDSRERMTETLDLLVRAWTEAPLVHQGKFYQVRLPALRPRPRQRPHPPLWRSVVTPASFRECGRLGVPIMTARIPLQRIPERLALYAAGLAESGHDDAMQRERRQQAAIWRYVHIAESQAQAEDELTAALLHTRQHMIHARTTHNPPDFQVDPALLNPWTDPGVADEEGVRYSMETGALCGTAAHVADRVAELRDAGVHHLLCQMSYGYVPHARVLESMRRFGEHVMPSFR